MISFIRLEAMDWRLVEVQPNTHQWFKFDEDGNSIGQQGDELWEKDIEICQVTH
jgi:hypothetical protein